MQEDIRHKTNKKKEEMKAISTERKIVKLLRCMTEIKRQKYTYKPAGLNVMQRKCLL